MIKRYEEETFVLDGGKLRALRPPPGRSSDEGPGSCNGSEFLLGREIFSRGYRLKEDEKCRVEEPYYLIAEKDEMTQRATEY